MGLVTIIKRPLIMLNSKTTISKQESKAEA
jgi:hypothetical protein